MNVFELFGKIAVDSSGAEKGLDKTLRHAKDTEGKLATTFKKIGKAAAAAFSVKAIVDFGKQCTQAYANIAAEESAFSQIMGDYSDTARAKLNAVADQTGVASTRMTGAMTSLTAKFKGLGYGVEDATTLASDGLLIAADAAAFWDMSLDESMSHLNSFINGSYEGGEAIGLFANDTQMAAYAVEQGIVKDAKAWAKLDEATKQATRLDYAKKMMKNSGATGQAAKEANSYANVMANLKESWRQFQGVIGKPILEKLVLPAMQKLNEFVPKLTESVQNGIVWLENGFDKIKEYFTDVFTEDGINLDALPDALSKMFRDLGSSAGKLLGKFGQTLRKGWSNTVWPMIQKTFKAVFGIELPDWATVKKNISDGWNKTVWPAIQGFFSKKFGITLPSWTELKTKVSNGWNKTVWPAIKGFFTKPFGITLPSWTDLKTKVSNGWNKTVWPAIKGFFTKPFGITLPSWTDLKKKVSNGWNKTVWPAIKGFFTKPFGITLPSWTDLKKKIVNSWEKTVKPTLKNVFSVEYWVKNPETQTVIKQIVDWWNTNIAPGLSNQFYVTFGVRPEDSTGLEVGKKLREWVDKAVEVLCGAGKKTLTIPLGVEPKDPDGETTGALLKQWWNSVETYMGNIFKGFFHIEPESDEATAADALLTWCGNVLKLVGTIHNPLLVVPTLKDIETDLKSLLDGVKAKLTTWWDGVVLDFKLSLPSWLRDLLGLEIEHGGGGARFPEGAGGGTGGTGAGGAGDGLPELPLHKRSSMEFGKQGGENSLPGMLATYAAQVETAAKNGSAAGVAEGMSGITITGTITTGNVMLDGTALVGKLTPKFNLALGGTMARYAMRNPNP